MLNMLDTGFLGLTSANGMSQTKIQNQFRFDNWICPKIMDVLDSNF